MGCWAVLAAVADTSKQLGLSVDGGGVREGRVALNGRCSPHSNPESSVERVRPRRYLQTTPREICNGADG